MAKQQQQQHSTKERPSEFNFSSPNHVHQLDQIPTAVLKFLVVLSPTLHYVARFIDLVQWRADRRRQSFLALLVWITFCLWTWHYLAFGLPSLVLYKLARDWFSIKLTRARREAMEQQRRRRHTTMTDNNTATAVMRYSDDDEEEEDDSELYVSRKIRTESTDVSLEETMADIATVNAFVDHVRLRWKQLMVHLDGTRADTVIGVLTFLGYAAPLWIVLCWLLGTQVVLAVVGSLVWLSYSPAAHVVQVALQRNVLLRHGLATLWAYGVAIVATSLRFQQQRQKVSTRARVSSWLASVLSRAKHEKSRTVQVIDYVEEKEEDSKRGTRSEMIFQFEVYENQRWWLGVNWTTNMMPSERGPWTDKQLKPIPAKEDFELPEPSVTTYDVDKDKNKNKKRKTTINKVWSWVDGDWWVDMTGEVAGRVDRHGWEYGNNAWKQMNGTATMQTFTRRRCWCRRARLVEREIVEEQEETKKDI
ncbi:MAG: Peroxin/Dysferlin domain-containing protein [Benjaminiella poitrasii]|nr:MAG: Peroxin/Dysferlin domain-containing protein [Benjaminiella poitrasii]